MIFEIAWPMIPANNHTPSTPKKCSPNESPGRIFQRPRLSGLWLRARPKLTPTLSFGLRPAGSQGFNILASHAMDGPVAVLSLVYGFKGHSQPEEQDVART